MYSLLDGLFPWVTNGAESDAKPNPVTYSCYYGTISVSRIETGTWPNTELLERLTLSRDDGVVAARRRNVTCSEETTEDRRIVEETKSDV